MIRNFYIVEIYIYVLLFDNMYMKMCLLIQSPQITLKLNKFRKLLIFLNTRGEEDTLF